MIRDINTILDFCILLIALPDFKKLRYFTILRFFKASWTFLLIVLLFTIISAVVLHICTGIFIAIACIILIFFAFVFSYLSDAIVKKVHLNFNAFGVDAKTKTLLGSGFSMVFSFVVLILDILSITKESYSWMIYWISIPFCIMALIILLLITVLPIRKEESDKDA